MTALKNAWEWLRDYAWLGWSLAGLMVAATLIVWSRRAPGVTTIDRAVSLIAERERAAKLTSERALMAERAAGILDDEIEELGREIDASKARVVELTSGRRDTGNMSDEEFAQWLTRGGL